MRRRRAPLSIARRRLIRKKKAVEQFLVLENSDLELCQCIRRDPRLDDNTLRDMVERHFCSDGFRRYPLLLRDYSNPMRNEPVD